MNNTEKVNTRRIANHITDLVTQAFHAILFDPMDQTTLANFRSMLSKGISQIKNAGQIQKYTIDVDYVHSPLPGIGGEITFTPYTSVEKIQINFSMDSQSDSFDVKSRNDQAFDKAMKGI